MTEAKTSNITSKLEFWHRKKLPILMQAEAAECGLTCLAMIASYHGNQIDLVSIRQQFRLSMYGATLHDLIQFSEHLKLSPRPLKVELENLTNLQTPCILHWNLNHFVVLQSANSKSLVIHDPANGKKRISKQEASKCFTGIVLELTPAKGFQKKNSKAKLKFSDFWSKITGLKKSLALMLSLSLVLQVFVLASPYYMQLVIDDVILTADTSLLSLLAIGFFLVLIFEIATSSLRGFTLLHFNNLMNVQLAANLFHHLIRLPMQYFEKRHMGDIVSRFGSLQYIRQLLTTGITETLIDGFMAIITLSMIFFYSVKLSLVVVSAVIIYAVIRIVTYRPLHEISEQEIVAKAEETSNFMETIRGIQTIKLFGFEPKRESQWQNRYTNAINQSIRLGNFSLGFSAINRFIFGIENILIIYLAAHLIISGGFSAGMLFAFISYKQQFMGTISNLIEKLIQFKMLSLHFERIADIALTKKEVSQSSQVKQHSITGKITCKNISYRYSDATPKVINELSLEINAGDSIAITGSSGCGKSTLLKLLLGLDTPQEGEIKIDDVPITQIGLKQYRQQIAAVMQNDELLSGSIAENIAFFETPVDSNKLIECAKLAAIHQDINKMPMGYESLVGEMGTSLSGGQKQRILLARAIYKKPKILFMDEATSHLDIHLESKINESIKKLKITRIIIAHRKETIASADREFCLDDNNLLQTQPKQLKKISGNQLCHLN